MSNQFFQKTILSLVITGMLLSGWAPVFAVDEPPLPTQNTGDGQGSVGTLLPPIDTTGTGIEPSSPGTGGVEQPTTRGFSAQPASTQQSQNIGNIRSSGGGDAQASAFRAGTTGTNVSGDTQVVAVDLLNCSAGQLLSQIIASGINTLFGSLSGRLQSTVTRLVPVGEQGEVSKDIKAQTSGHTIQHAFGVPFGSSFDAMAWCIVNSIITYVADATIAWANRGFQGKPAFLQNPDRFFQTLADQEASKFIQGIAYNTTGLNVCQPFRVQISLGLSGAYGNQYRPTCSIAQISRNFENFAQNGITIGTTYSGRYGPQRNVQLRRYWSNFYASTRDQNNIYGSYLMANQFLHARITAQNNTARFELGLNKGWLSFKKCSNPNDPNSCDTYTPGTLIQSSLEKTLGLPKDRLVAVQKFDQVITAVVNSLIRVALQKVLESNK